MPSPIPWPIYSFPSTYQTQALACLGVSHCAHRLSLLLELLELSVSCSLCIVGPHENLVLEAWEFS